MSIVPLRDLVYVLPMMDREKIGSLHIPEQAKQRVDQGIVKYRGDAVMEVRVGDHVAFSGWAGDRIVTEDEGTLFVMPERDIIFILDEKEPTKVFTEAHFNEWLDRLKGDMHRSGIFTHKWVVEKLRSYMEDHTYEEMRF